MFCQYRHVLGVEGQGLHSVRILNVAVVDLLGTLFFGALISYYFKTNVYLTFLVLIVLGIILHRLFCVNTTLNTMIFGTV